MDNLHILFQDGVPDKVLEKLLGQLPTIVKQEQKRLLEDYGYAAKRHSEMDTTLYLKAAFLSKKLPENNVYGKRILNTLLADQGILFTSTDTRYQNNKINNKLISTLTPLFNHSTRRRRLYYDLLVWKRRNINESMKAIHIAFLDKIYELATITYHRKLKVWLREHDFDIEPDSPGNLAFLREILPEYSDQVDQQFCYTFFRYVLPEYEYRVGLVDSKNLRPDELPINTSIDDMRLFVVYKARLHRLNSLENGFSQDMQSVLQLNQIRSVWSFSEDCASNHVESLIEAAIYSFFYNRGDPLKANLKNNIASRIRWAAKEVEKSSIKRTLYPAYFLYMVISCNRRISSGTEVEFCISGSPQYDNRIGIPKQRYAQLLLLEELCDIFSVSQTNRIQNWIQFLFWQGKQIKSREEVCFWRRQLGGNYEILPVIGFQLCCLDYLKDCLPLDLSRLSYNLVSDFKSGNSLHLGGYHRFWTENQDVLKEQAMMLNLKYPQYVKDYKALWSSAPEKYFHESKGWLDKLLDDNIAIDLSTFEDFSVYDAGELKRLILETELRICVNINACRSLIKNCKYVYGLSEGLFDGIL